MMMQDHHTEASTAAYAVMTFVLGLSLAVVEALDTWARVIGAIAVMVVAALTIIRLTIEIRTKWLDVQIKKKQVELTDQLVWRQAMLNKEFGSNGNTTIDIEHGTENDKP